MIRGNIKSYSVPANYEVVEKNGLKGLVRHDKDGDKWLLEPLYREVIFGKCCGKILVCRDGGMYSDYMTLHTYSGKLALNTKIYDIIFGESFLYILTERNGGSMEWCWVDPGMQGGKFIGAVEFIDRNTNAPFHVKKGVTETRVMLGEDIYKLDYSEGSMALMPKKVEVVEAPITECNIRFIVREKGAEVPMNTVMNCVHLTNVKTNCTIEHSTSIGEIEMYKGLITNILGGVDGVPIDRAKKLINLLNKLENYGNPAVLPILYQYAKGVSKEFGLDVIDAMNRELEGEWSSIKGYGEIKAYASGPAGVILTRGREGRIVSTLFLVTKEKDDPGLKGADELLDCYQKTGCPAAKLLLRSAEELEYNDELDKLITIPYSIKQRKKLFDTVGKFNYATKRVVRVEMGIMGVDGYCPGTMQMHIFMMKDLYYSNKSKNAGGMIKTGKMNLVVLENV